MSTDQSQNQSTEGETQAGVPDFPVLDENGRAVSSEQASERAKKPRGKQAQNQDEQTQQQDG
jgi:hypothetical protein